MDRAERDRRPVSTIGLQAKPSARLNELGVLGRQREGEEGVVAGFGRQ